MPNRVRVKTANSARSVCIISSIRLIYLMQFNGTGDFTFANVALVYWTCVEVHASIVVACSMTLKPLVSRFLPTLLGQRKPSAQGIAMAEAGVAKPAPRPKIRHLGPPAVKHVNFLGWSGHFGTGFGMAEDKGYSLSGTEVSFEKKRRPAQGSARILISSNTGARAAYAR